MNTINEALKKRMRAQFDAAARNKVITTEIVPGLERGVTRLRTAVNVNHIAIPEVEKQLDRLNDLIKALKDSQALETEALNEVEAAAGHLHEAADDLPAQAHEAAHLALLMQYYEIAAKGSPEFWTDTLGMVDPPVLAAAWEKLPQERRDILRGVLQEVQAE